VFIADLFLPPQSSAPFPPLKPSLEATLLLLRSAPTERPFAKPRCKASVSARLVVLFLALSLFSSYLILLFPQYYPPDYDPDKHGSINSYRGKHALGDRCVSPSGSQCFSTKPPPRTEPARSTKASSSCASSYRITSGGAYRAPALSLLKCSDPNRAFSSSLFPPLPHLFSPCFPPDPPTLHPVPRRLTVTTARITSVKESVTTPRRNKLELTTRRKSGRSVSNATFVKDG
jgi:hypothetical protein